MRNNLKITESQINRIVKRVLNEDEFPHPIETKFWREMDNELTGDGVEVLEMSNDKLVIDGIKYRYTILRKKI